MPWRPQAHKPARIFAVPKVDRRPTAGKRGYDGRWQKARACYLASNPLCAECRKTGRIVAAVVVDHVIPHRGDMALFWSESNWQGLCGPCHSAKTARGE